jgi:hypothetical protein
MRTGLEFVQSVPYVLDWRATIIHFVGLQLLCEKIHATTVYLGPFRKKSLAHCVAAAREPVHGGPDVQLVENLFQPCSIYAPFICA